MIKNFELFNISDIGRRRQNNEDYYAAFQNENWLLLVLCDGMGGVEGGEIASQLAVKAIGEYFKKKFTEPNSFFVNSVKFANEVIRKRSAQKKHLAEMGTTLVALLYNGKEVYYAHVGDSRLYLFRNKQLKQLTHDHTYVGELLKRGVLSNTQAENHRYKNRISRCIGYLNSEPEIAPSPVIAEEGDIFLLCSDGLTDMVSDEKIAQILNSTHNLDEAAQKLVNEANKNGGRDNITIQLLKIKKEGSIPIGGLSDKTKKSKKKLFSLLSVVLVLLISGLVCTFQHKKALINAFGKALPSLIQGHKQEPNKAEQEPIKLNKEENIRNIGEFDSLIFLLESNKDRKTFLRRIQGKLDTLKVHTLFYPKNVPIAIQKNEDNFILIVSAGLPDDSLKEDKSIIKYLQKHGFGNFFKSTPTNKNKTTRTEEGKDILMTNQANKKRRLNNEKLDNQGTQR